MRVLDTWPTLRMERQRYDDSPNSGKEQQLVVHHKSRIGSLRSDSFRSESFSILCFERDVVIRIPTTLYEVN